MRTCSWYRPSCRHRTLFNRSRREAVGCIARGDTGGRTDLRGAAIPFKPDEVLYADPLWPFRPWSWSLNGRNVDDHHRTMRLEEIMALPVGRVSARDSVLFLWTTGPFLERAFEVIEAWGIKCKTIGFVRVKANSDEGRLFAGNGHYRSSG